MEANVRTGGLVSALTRGHLRSVLGGCAAVAAIEVLASLALACDTPVYRYAMYRWPPAPYHVLYFHRGSPDAKDGEANRLLDEAGSKPVPANVAFESIDVSRDETLKFLPEELRNVWQAHRQEGLPRHVILAPRMGELWSGRMDASEAKRLLDSPLRKKIAQLLHEGHAAVLVLVPGSDGAATRQAEEVLNKAIAQPTAAGKAGQPSVAEVSPNPGAGLSPTSSDAKGAAPEGGRGGQPAPLADPSVPVEGLKPLRLALVKLDRKDGQEQWLLRSLLAMQTIAPEKQKEPLLYAIFGRGRALGPCVGEQISADSIDELVAFLGGACSCVIKDQNPGVDLLFTWDWEATAEHLAQTEEPAAGVGPEYAEVPADMPPGLPGAQDQLATGQACCPLPKPEVATAASGTGAAGSADSTDSGVGSAGLGVPAGKGDRAEGGTGATASPGSAASPQSDEASHPSASATAAIVPSGALLASGTPQPSFAGRQLWQFGLGLGILAGAILLAGIWILRRARYDTP